MKDELRREMIARRESHHASVGHKHCLEIMEKVVSLPQFNSSKCILLYCAKGGEVHTDGIIQKALSLGKKVVLPVTIRERHELELYEIKSMDELSAGAFGIMEPARKSERRVFPEEIDLAIVPGVLFDRRGHRIGYGMGYYDSLLRKVKGCKVGLAYDIQIIGKIPNEPHDVALDMVITPSETIICKECGAGQKGKYRVAVLASGRGSNFAAIIEAAKRGEIDVEIVGLITDNPNAKAMERAKENGIPAFAIEYSSREELDRKIMEKLEELKPDLVVLAGYMKVIKNRELLSRYYGRMINIHPSLLPKYPGAHAQRDAFEAGEKISGYTIHFVDETLDGGPIIHQEKVDISECKSAEEVAAKILEREHVGLPAVIGKFARGEIKGICKGKTAV